jgi:hypothetical protein
MRPSTGKPKGNPTIQSHMHRQTYSEASSEKANQQPLNAEEHKTVALADHSADGDGTALTMVTIKTTRWKQKRL